MKKRFMTMVLAIGAITASNAQVDANNNANLNDVNIGGELVVDGEVTLEELFVETLDTGVISTNYIYNSKGLFLKYDSTVSQLSFGRRADGNYNSTINTADDNTLEFKNTSGGGSFDFLSNVGGNGTKSVFYLDGSKGNVGIGTDNPYAKLQVDGGSLSVLKDNVDSSNGSLWKKSNHHLELRNDDKKDVVLSFHRVASSNAAIIHDTSGNIVLVPEANSTDIKKKTYFDNNGNVGIGTDNPVSKLDVRGDISLTRANRINFLKPENSDKRAFIGSTNGEGGDWSSLVFGVGSEVEAMRIKNNGNVGIGTARPDSPLTVNGQIHAKEVLVDTNIFADYVFKNDYELKSLEQVESYIAKEGHLEGFKSEKELVKEGLNLKEVTIKQQEKIEELTLYLIELSKEVKSLKAQLNKK